MELTVNGASRQVELPVESATVAALIARLGIAEPRGLAVALNQRIVPRSQWEVTPVNAGDAVELVRATQGG